MTPKERLESDLKTEFDLLRQQMDATTATNERIATLLRQLDAKA